MSESSDNVPAPVPHEPWKFQKGNKLGRGDPNARAARLFRTQAIREIKRTKAIPAALDQLMRMALYGERKMRVRVKKEGEKTAKRTMVYVPINEKAHVAALQELLSRGLGKSTIFKVFEDVTPTRPAVDLAKLIEAYRTLGVPEERWPPQAREHVKRIESKEVEPNAGT